MIKIDFSIAIAFYIFISGVSILFMWVYFDRKKFTTDDFYMWLCSVWTYHYVNSIHKDISVCPMCASYNKREVKQ